MNYFYNKDTNTYKEDKVEMYCGEDPLLELICDDEDNSEIFSHEIETEESDWFESHDDECWWNEIASEINCQEQIQETKNQSESEHLYGLDGTSQQSFRESDWDDSLDLYLNEINNDDDYLKEDTDSFKKHQSKNEEKAYNSVAVDNESYLCTGDLRESEPPQIDFEMNSREWSGGIDLSFDESEYDEWCDEAEFDKLEW